MSFYQEDEEIEDCPDSPMYSPLPSLGNLVSSGEWNLNLRERSETTSYELATSPRDQLNSPHNNHNNKPFDGHCTDNGYKIFQMSHWVNSTEEKLAIPSSSESNTNKRETVYGSLGPVVKRSEHTKRTQLPHGWQPGLPARSNSANIERPSDKIDRIAVFDDEDEDDYNLNEKSRSANNSINMNNNSRDVIDDNDSNKIRRHTDDRKTEGPKSQVVEKKKKRRTRVVEKLRETKSMFNIKVRRPSFSTPDANRRQSTGRRSTAEQIKAKLSFYSPK
jgi:hypothetical protein